MACTTSRLFTLALLLTLGCSSSNDGDNDDDAPGKCSAMVSDFCNTVADCAVEEDAIPSSDRSGYLSECVQKGESTIGCSDAVGVASNYASCLDAVHALECSDFVASVVLPSECSKVIEVPE